MNLIFVGLSPDAAYLNSRFPGCRSHWFKKIVAFPVFLNVVQPPKLCSTMGNDFDEKKKAQPNVHKYRFEA